MLNEAEKQELLETARSQPLQKDMRHLAANRQRLFRHDGRVDLDKFVEFLNGFNEFINHRPKLFKPVVEKILKL